MIASFLITFRETLEAVLIITILIAYLARINRRDLHRYVWVGAVAAMAISVLIGLVVATIHGSFTGVSEKLFEGTASILATGVLTYMVFWMAKNARRIRGEIEEKVDIAITSRYLFGIAALSFIAVVREGIETILFLTAIATSDPKGTVIGAITGIALVMALAVLLMKGMYRLDIRRFFKITSILLIIFAAGLLGYGVHEFMEAAENSGLNLGILAEAAFNTNPSDITHPLHEKGVVGSVLKTLIGYDGNPEILRIIVYLAYWTAIGMYLVKTYSIRPGVAHRNLINARRKGKMGLMKKKS
ncbi:MAG: FTR1 family protein [bacterium]